MPSLYAVFATDAAGRADVRNATRAAHRLHLRQPDPDGVLVVLGGPTLDAAGAMNGSLLVLQAESEAQVRRFLARDPYLEAGVFESVSVREWRCGLVRPEHLPNDAPPSTSVSPSPP